MSDLLNKTAELTKELQHLNEVKANLNNQIQKVDMRIQEISGGVNSLLHSVIMVHKKDPEFFQVIKNFVAARLIEQSYQVEILQAIEKYIEGRQVVSAIDEVQLAVTAQPKVMTYQAYKEAPPTIPPVVVAQSEPVATEPPAAKKVVAKKATTKK